METTGQKLSLVPIDRHITITSAEEVRAICEPLARSLVTPYFNYVRRFVDGSQFGLCTDADWNAMFLQRGLYNYLLTDKGNVGGLQCGSQLKIMPWGPPSDWKLLAIQRGYSGISSGITIADIKLSYTDFYYFGTTCDEPWIGEFYMSNADLFLRFCDYFHERAADLLALRRDRKNLIYLPITSAQKKVFPRIKVDDFIESTRTKKTVIDTPSGPVTLSRKERHCIQWLCQGLTVKGVARKLEISPRTVESHLNAVKSKFGLATKSDLIKFFLNHSSRLALPDAATGLPKELYASDQRNPGACRHGS
jgi:DNA-binding CsgD family transcriptional regulator